MPESNIQTKRATAYKLRIGDIFNGQVVMEEDRFNFVKIGDKEVMRANIIANIIDKYAGEGEKKFLSYTIDDASGQIKIRVFGDDVPKFQEITQGNTVLVIGKVRYYNSELYILPEIIKVQDPRYLLVRKLELDKEIKAQPKEFNKEEIKAVKDQIIDMIKISEDSGGLDVEKIILDLKADPEIINKEVKKLLEEGVVYEPRPGKIRYLG